MKNQSTPTQIPDQFLNINTLGPIVGVFRPGASNRWVAALFGVILLGISGLIAVYGLYDTYVQASRYGPVMIGKTIFGPLIVAFIIFLLGAVGVYNAYTNWNKIAVLYENGVAFNDNKGLQTWSWLDVEWLFMAVTRHYTNGVYTGTTYTYTLRKINGDHLVLNNRLKNIEVLGTYINRKVAPLQYEKLARILNNNQEINLGKVILSKQSFGINKKVYPWQEIKSVTIRKGYLSIQKIDGNWLSGATAPVSAIPNLDALLAIVDQFIKIKSG